MIIMERRGLHFIFCMFFSTVIYCCLRVCTEQRREDSIKNMGNDLPENNRKVYLDLLRIVAIFMVLYNHTGTKGYVLFTVARTSPLYWFYLFFSICIKVSVPIFFMISGALLLSKQEIAGKVIYKRIKRFATILFLGSAINYLYQMRLDLSKISVVHFFQNLYAGNILVPYWFLYAYLAFLVVLPLLQSFAKSLNWKQYIYMIGVFIMFQCLYIAEYIWGRGGISHNGSFNFFMANSSIFYPMLGYFLEKRLPSSFFAWKNYRYLIVASILAVGICCVLTNNYCTLNNAWTESTCQNFMGTLTVIPAITIYSGTKLWFINHKVSPKIEKIIITAGNCTFGIYLFEQIYRERTVWLYYILYPILHSFPACILWVTFACLLGGIVTLIMKKIPVMKELL